MYSRAACSSQLAFLLLVLLSVTAKCNFNSSSSLDRLLFASAEDLLLCLGAPLNASRAGLELLDCDLPSASWRRSLATREDVAPLRLGAFPNLCLWTNETAAGSPDEEWNPVQLWSCENFWIFDSDSRLQLFVNSSSYWPQCLSRANYSDGVPLHMENCTVSSEQQWIPLARGPKDPNARLDEVQFPLKAFGRHFIDASGRIVRLRGVNWYGAHMEQRVNNGLDRVPLQRMAKLIRHLGFNSVRMNYAVQMWFEQTVPVDPDRVRANPQLFNKSSLGVFADVVKALTDQGLMVIINCHTSDFRWCCSLTDDQSLWYNSRWSEAQWLESLTGIAAYFASNPRVIGLDPRNEPRPAQSVGKNGPILVWWDPADVFGACELVIIHSSGQQDIVLGKLSKEGICLQEHTADWRLGAQEAAYAIWHGNPDALVFLEGTGGADLVQTMKKPIALPQPCMDSRLVYSVHEYPWFWKWFQLSSVLARGGDSFLSIFEKLSGIYDGTGGQDGNYPNFVEERMSAWAFLLASQQKPVWIGEFGESSRSSFWTSFVRFAGEMDVDWAYWSIDGLKYPKGMHIDTSYMDITQRIQNDNLPFEEDVHDTYGLLRVDYVGASQMDLLSDLVIHLQAPVLTNGTPASLAEAQSTCIFSTTLHPIRGTGPHPAGFSTYMNLNVPQSCHIKDRRLQFKTGSSDGNASLPADKSVEEISALALQAEESQRAACSALGAPTTGSQRASARSELWLLAPRPNPVDVIFSGSSNFIQAASLLQEDFLSLLSSASKLIVALGVTVPLILIVMCVLACVGMRKGGEWVTPYVMLGRCARRCLCNIRGRRGDPLSSPRQRQGLTEVYTTTKAWRPVFGISYFSILICLVGLTIWGLVGRARMSGGIDATKCAAMSGINGALNGNAGFIGMLPALARLKDVLGDLSDGSPMRARLQAFVQELQDVRTELDLVRSIVSTLNRTLGDGSCGYLTPGLLHEVSQQVEWGVAQTMVLALNEIQVLLPSSNGVVQEIRTQLDTGNSALQNLQQSLVQEVNYFLRHDPLSAATGILNLALGALLALFCLVVPISIAGFVAIARFSLGEWLDSLRIPCLPSKCRLPRCCARSWDPADLGLPPDVMRAKAIKEQMRPRAALMTWTAALLYAPVALGLGVWLQPAVSLTASACAVFDDLTAERLHRYAPALGLTVGPPIVQRTTMSIVTDCVSIDRGKNGGLLQLWSCPESGAPSQRSFMSALNTTSAQLNRTFSDLKNLLKDQELLGRQACVIQLMGELRNLALSEEFPRTYKRCYEDLNETSIPYIDYNSYNSSRHSHFTGIFPNPVADQLTLQQDVSGKAYELLCPAWDPSSGCNQSLIDPHFLVPEAAALLALVEQRVNKLDRSVQRGVKLVLGQLWAEVDSRILSNLAAIADGLQCGFVRATLDQALDGVCYKLILGLSQIQRALLGIGILSILQSVCVYFLWVWLRQVQVLAAEHQRGATKASSGGTIIDLTIFSRAAALGHESGTFSVPSSPSLPELSSARNGPTIPPLAGSSLGIMLEEVTGPVAINELSVKGSCLLQGLSNGEIAAQRGEKLEKETKVSL